MIPLREPVIAPAITTGPVSNNCVTGASVQPGDMLVFFHGKDFYDAASLTAPDGTIPSVDWTLRATGDAGVNKFHIKLWTALATVAGVHSIHGTSTGTNDSTHYAHMFVVDGDGLTLSVDDAAGGNGGVTTSHVIPSLNVVGSDDKYLAASGAGPDQSGNYTPPGGLTKDVEQDNGAASTMASYSQDLVASGATGTRTVTFSAAEAYATVAIAIRGVESGETHAGTGTATVGIDPAATGVKVAAGTGAAGITGNATSAGLKNATGTASSPITLSATGEGGAFVEATVSEVLCGPWATPEDIPQSIKDQLALTDAQWLAPLMRASELLWMLAGRQWYGVGCTEQATLKSVAGQGVWPYDNSWGDCGCWEFGGVLDGVDWTRFPHVPQPVAIHLPRSPVAAITSVTVDGVPLLSTDYRLLRNGWLERVGGTWDTCGAATVVTYTFGEPPPAGGRDSAITLAVELAKDFYGLDGCRLPKRTTSVVRQGVSITMSDPADFLEKGKTGLISVDLWLSAVNPQARPRRGGVWSPDVPTTRRSPL